MGLLAPGLLAAFSLWLGGLSSGAEAINVLLGVATLALVAAAGALVSSFGPLDPFALGAACSRGALPRWLRMLFACLPWCVLTAVAVSWWASPVSRAGLMALAYGPWLILLVPAVGWSVASVHSREWARIGMQLVLVAVAGWGLVDWLWLGSERAAMPLGHHNLLALWLVAVLPVCALPRRWQMNLEGGSRRSSSFIGLLEIAALALGLLALLGTRSLAGALGFSAQLALLIALGPRLRGGRVDLRRALGGGLAIAAVLLAVGWQRFALLATSTLDRSTAARWQYINGALSGWLERPLLGYGPGSSSWLLGGLVDSKALPRHQVVTDAHSLPVDLLFELGLVGVVAITLLAAVWLRANFRLPDHTTRASDIAWVRSVDVALLGLAVTSTVSGYFDVLAVWLLFPVLLGLRSVPWLSSDALDRRRFGDDNARPGNWGRSVRVRRSVAVLALLLLTLAYRPVAAQFAYQRALNSGSVDRLRTAVETDPAHPLYRWTQGRWTESSRDATDAAARAEGLAALYLSAGALAGDDGGSAAVEALTEACDLSPHDPIAPFLLATVRELGRFQAERPTQRQVLSLQALARALLNEPRLLATPELLLRPDLRHAAVGLLAGRDDLSMGWRAALVEAEAALPDQAREVLSPVDLVLFADEVGEVSLSLYAFRRLPHEAELARVALDGERAATITMPPASLAQALIGNPWASGCRLSAD